MVKHPAINTVLERLEREELETRVEYAKQVRSLMETPGWHLVKRFIDEALEDKLRELSGWGGIPPYEQITTRQGFYRGLLTASMTPDAIIESGERAQKELEQIVRAQENRT